MSMKMFTRILAQQGYRTAPICVARRVDQKPIVPLVNCFDTKTAEELKSAQHCRVPRPS